MPAPTPTPTPTRAGWSRVVRRVLRPGFYNRRQELLYTTLLPTNSYLTQPTPQNSKIYKSLCRCSIPKRQRLYIFRVIWCNMTRYRWRARTSGCDTEHPCSWTKKACPRCYSLFSPEAEEKKLGIITQDLDGKLRRETCVSRSPDYLEYNTTSYQYKTAKITHQELGSSRTKTDENSVLVLTLAHHFPEVQPVGTVKAKKASRRKTKQTQNSMRTAFPHYHGAHVRCPGHVIGFSLWLCIKFSVLWGGVYRAVYRVGEEPQKEKGAPPLP